MTLRRALAPDSDAVVYQDRVVHVASWAARFLFTGEQLNQPVGRLSGGERARVLIAQLMLQPADLLLLDEPTNDLDIPTLEILEESLLEYTGALVLVTHDRYMLDRVSTMVLGLDGRGGAEVFADYLQWEEWQAESKQPARAESDGSAAAKPAKAAERPPKRNFLILRRASLRLSSSGLRRQRKRCNRSAPRRKILRLPAMQRAAESTCGDGRSAESCGRALQPMGGTGKQAELKKNGWVM